MHIYIYIYNESRRRQAAYGGNMKIFKKMKKGFTLVELVVVIAVIAILAAVSVGAYFGVTESANRSKLEQEGKQVQTAIQTISLAGNEHSSLTSNGLVITNPGAFELALEESLGKEVALTDAQNTKDNTNPTIYFTDVAIQSTLGDKTYKTFEYHLPEINGKTAQVNVVTGEVTVVNSTAEGTDVPNAPIAISLEEANRIGLEQEHNTYTTQEYIVEGIIDEITSVSNGRVWIKSGDIKFYIYSLYQGETQYKDLENKPDEGDTIKIQGTIGNYEGTAQIKKGQILSFVPGEVAIPDPIEVTLAEANTIASGYEHNTTSFPQEYIVEGVIQTVESTTFGNMVITDGTDTLNIYGVYQGETRYDSLDVKPNEGDTVRLQGVLGKYNDDNQLKNAQLLSHTEGTPVEPDDPYSVSISFDDLSKSTVFTEEQQVWTENDITVTNNKGASTTAIDVENKYHDPVRFYKNSEVIINYVKNIVKIEVDTPEAKYATALVNSIEEGATVTADDRFATVELASPCTQFSFVLSGGQARVNSLKITFNDETPVLPQEPVEEKYTLTINPTPAEATVVLTAEGFEANGNSIEVTSGTEVTYTVSHDGYNPVTQTVSVTETNTIDVTLTPIQVTPDPEEPEEKEPIVFEFGANSTKTPNATNGLHEDGSDLGASKTYTEGDYSLELTSMYKVFGPAYDKVGNSCIKLGTSSVVGSFSFTVPEDVNAVIINVAGYKAATSTNFKINNVSKTTELPSNDGAYEAFEIDTTTTKTINFVSVTKRLMINSISFVF